MLSTRIKSDGSHSSEPKMNAPKTLSSRFIAPTPVGLLLRSLALTIPMIAVLCVSFAIQYWVQFDVESKWITASFLVIYVSMILGLVTSEYPDGAEFMLFRLGVATFCRTGFPLLVILLAARYSVSTLGKPVLGYLAAFYLVGFPISIWLSLLRANPHVDQESVEVDRAAV